MRPVFILLTLIFASCSTSSNLRNPASDVWNIDRVMISKSSIRLLSIDLNEESKVLNFYVHAKNSIGNDTDFNVSDVTFVFKNQMIEYKYQRESSGRYYFQIDVSSLPKGIDFIQIYFQDKEFALINIKTYLTFTDVSGSTYQVTDFEDHYIIEIELKNSLGERVESAKGPELLLEDFGEIEGPQRGKNGEWYFKLVPPEKNALIYGSMRINSSSLYRFIRIQHIEK